MHDAILPKNPMDELEKNKKEAEQRLNVQEQQNAVSNEQQEVNQVTPTSLSPPPSHKKLIIGIVAVFVLVVVGFVGGYFPTVKNDGGISSQPSEPTPSSAAETRYITFALSIPMRACDQAIFRQGFEKSVNQIRTNVGTLGNNKNRKLGFALYVPAWDVEKMSGEDKNGAACYKLLVETATDVAILNDVAIHFMVGTHISWGTRPDLWNHFDSEAEGYSPANIDNVEWHDWSGTANQQNYIGWLPGGRAAPVMCFNCPGITSEVIRMVKTIFAPTLLSARDTFTQAGKPELFAGITIGDEIGIHNWEDLPESNQIVQLMREDGVEPTRLGYHALTNLGFTEADEPIDYVAELGKVNQDFLALWSRLFSEAGFDRDELFTRHPAGQADFTRNNAPLWTAVNDYALPGYSTYPGGPLKDDFNDIYDTLAAYNITNWAGNETNPATPSKCLSGNSSGRVTTREHLKRHFDHGAILVNLNANDGREILRNCLEKVMWDEESVRAYNDFLNETL